MIAAIDVVRRNRDLREVVEKVVQQNLRRKHREERQEYRGDRHAEHVAEVRARAHQQVLHHVARSPAAFENPAVQHFETRLAENDVRCLARDVGRGHHGNADVGRV